MCAKNSHWDPTGLFTYQLTHIPLYEIIHPEHVLALATQIVCNAHMNAAIMCIQNFLLK